MDKEQVASWLTQMCQGKEWFHSVGWDQYGRAVVYVRYMDGEILRFVPDYTEDGKQVLCHFVGSLTSKAGDFMDKPEERKMLTPTQFMTQAREAAKNGADVGVGQMLDDLPEVSELLDEAERDRQLELSVRALTDELDKLERLCGSNILQDIFYEIHDKENAVTNLSAKFPEVRTRMQKLYDKYGFDIVYEELDG